MPVRHNSLFPWPGRLAICALALGACAVTEPPAS